MVVLVLLSVIILLLPKVYFYFKPVQHADDAKLLNELKQTLKANGAENDIDTTTTTAQQPEIKTTTAETKEGETKSEPKHTTKKNTEGYFEFDPNKIGIDEWVKLGFTEKQASTIEHYKEKGGRFYRPEDLMRLYVMDEPHYNKLYPYVKIDKDALPKRNYNKY